MNAFILNISDFIWYSYIDAHYSKSMSQYIFGQPVSRKKNVLKIECVNLFEYPVQLKERLSYIFPVLRNIHNTYLSVERKNTTACGLNHEVPI